MAGPTARESGFDITLNGVPYRVVRDERGVPAWEEKPMPATEGKEVRMIQVERRWDTWHVGAGYDERAVPGGYSYATGADARFLGQILPPPNVYTITDTAGGAGAALFSSAVNAFFEQSSFLYAISGQYCARVDLANDDIDTPAADANGKDFGATYVAASAANFDGNTIVGFSSTTATHYLWKFNGTTWTQSTGQASVAALTRHWSDDANAWVLAAAVFGTASAYTCAQGAEPTTPDNWAGPTVVGDTSSPITGLAGSERTLWVAKTDGLYYIDLARTPRVLETKLRVATNGNNLLVDAAGYVYYSCKEAYYRYDPRTGEVADVSPTRGLPNRYLPAEVTAHVTYKGWLYAAIWDGTTSYLLAGRPRENEPGLGAMIWHGTLIPGVTSKITALHVSGLASSATQPRLYIGYDSGAVKYIILPRYGDNPRSDSACRYGANTYMYFSMDDWGTPSTLWLPLSFEVQSIGAGGDFSPAIDMVLDETTTVRLGSLTTSPQQIFSVPAPTPTLEAAITAAGTTVTVSAATGFPGGSGGNYYIRIDNEVMLVTAGNGTTSWTVTRAQRGTTAAAHNVKATVTPDYRFTTMRLAIWFLTTTGTELVTNGTFASNITGWTDASAAGGSIAWNAAGYMDIISNGTGTARARSTAVTTIVGKAYQLTFSVGTGALTYKIGTSAGASDIGTALVQPGSNAVVFTATTTTTHLEFSHTTNATHTLDTVSVLLPVNDNICYIRGITGYALQRPQLYKMVECQLDLSDRVPSHYGVAHRQSGKQQQTNLDTIQSGSLTTLEDWWTGSKRTRTALVGPVYEKIVTNDKGESVGVIASINIAVAMP